ncbi:hypothetical protein [Chryseobacterium sp. IT-36CA2]|uniref:hypothetical protein n=1 Tax=Chryseobacterium sp. IT-36CA2 TaxID=3026460 RepID=UPI0039E13957
MDELNVSTKDPHALISEIIDKINNNDIRSWKYNDTDEIFYHKGPQYIDHIYFKVKVDDAKGILKFILYSDGNEFAESRAFQLLEGMLGRHFSGSTQII